MIHMCINIHVFVQAKLEEAAELYERAGNGFKINKQWNEAGQAFLQCADCHMKLEVRQHRAFGCDW